MKQLLFFTILAGIVFLHIRNVSSEAVSAAPWSPGDLSFCTVVDSTQRIYRSDQPTKMELDSLLETGLIDRVLRFNGDGSRRERGAMYHSEEEKLCQQHNVEMIYINLDAQAYGSVSWDSTIHYTLSILNRGGVLLHCRNNMHRAGLIAGLYQAQRGRSWDDILDHNNWWELAERPGEYVRYVEPVYLAAIDN